MSNDNNNAERAKRPLIWDLPVRLFHWALAVLIAGSWYTVDVTGDMNTHMLIGYTILTLLLFRIVWGFVGPRYARFSNMLYQPRTIVRYARALFTSRQHESYAGHTPLGGLSALAMLALVGLQVSTGLFATDEDFYSGPLNEHVSGATGSALTNVHETNFNILLAVIVLHVAAILYYLLVKKQNLIGAMLSGRKDPRTPGAVAIPGSKLTLAVALAAAAAGSVYVLVNFL